VLTTRSNGRSFDLPILMYHDLEADDSRTEFSISIDQFESHLDWLRNHGFTTIGFNGLLAALEGHPLPSKPAMITFDDGYESFRRLAVPALAARHMTATVFIVAGEIGGFNRWDSSTGGPERALMDEQGIREVLGAGIEVGSHGWNHRDLTRCSPPELEAEIVRSRHALRDRFGDVAEVFAYPYGRHSVGHFDQLESAGYRAAVSIFSLAATVTGNVYAMRRIHIHSEDTSLRFKAKVSAPYLRYAAWRDRRGMTGLPHNHEVPAHG
jgi:peptidoglycan/xylan/chitin deacetylase (PgdA/CDA1 family)